MSEASTPHRGALLRRGIGYALLIASSGCASHNTQSQFPLVSSSQQTRSDQEVCVQIGVKPADGKIACNQLALPDAKLHVEPLPLDEFGYLFPPLKPEAEQVPAPAGVKTAQAAPIKSNSSTASASYIAVTTVPVTQSVPVVIAPSVATAVAPVAATTLQNVASVKTAPSTPIATTSVFPAHTPTVAIPHYITKTVRFSTRLPFKLNSAHLAGKNRREILAFVNSLEKYRGVEHILITGHTDTSGPASFNRWLSGMRAKSVELMLLSLGADPRTTQMRGVGSSKPRPHAHSAADNRYVDIEVTVRAPAS